MTNESVKKLDTSWELKDPNGITTYLPLHLDFRHVGNVYDHMEQYWFYFFSRNMAARKTETENKLLQSHYEWVCLVCAEKAAAIGLEKESHCEMPWIEYVEENREENYGWWKFIHYAVTGKWPEDDEEFQEKLRMDEFMEFCRTGKYPE